MSYYTACHSKETSTSIMTVIEELDIRLCCSEFDEVVGETEGIKGKNTTTLDIIIIYETKERKNSHFMWVFKRRGFPLLFVLLTKRETDVCLLIVIFYPTQELVQEAVKRPSVSIITRVVSRMTRNRRRRHPKQERRLSRL